MIFQLVGWWGWCFRPSLLRSNTSSATKWSRSISMPFLTTPTSSRDLPWMDEWMKCPHTLYTSTHHAHTYITMQKAAYSHLMDFFIFILKKKKDSSQLDLWMGWTAPEEKGTDVSARRTGQCSRTEKITEMPSWIFCNIGLVNTALHPYFLTIFTPICIYTYCVASYYFGFKHSFEFGCIFGWHL